MHGDKEFINFLTNVNVIVPDIERLFQIISAAAILVLFLLQPMILASINSLVDPIELRPGQGFKSWWVSSY